MERLQHVPLGRRSSRTNWLKKAPHKDPMRLKSLSNNQLTSSVLNAINCEDIDITENFQMMCNMIKATLPLELRTLVVQEVCASASIKDHITFTRMLLLHLLTDVQHIDISSDLAVDCWINLTEEHCNELLNMLGSSSRFNLLSLHIEGVTFVKGVLAEIIHRSPRLTSIHVSGDDAASEVLSYIAKNPRGLHSLHLDTCNVNDQDVVHALVKSYNEADSWTDLDATGIDNTEVDEDFPPLLHLSIQSPLVTVCGALVLLHFLRNLRTLQYSYWNTSICNLLYYLQQQSPRAAPFALTSMSLWRVTEKSLDTLKLCPNLQHLMMECTDPSLTSMNALSQLPHLNSLTLRLVPEELLVSAVRSVGEKLLYLDIEYEEYARTPIRWETVQAIQKHCPKLQRLEMHHINMFAERGDSLSPLFSPSFVDLVQLNLSSVALEPGFLSRLLYKNSCLESLILDVNQEALTDSVFMTLAKNNDFSFLNYVFLNSAMMSFRPITYCLTLPSMAKISIRLSNFPSLPLSTFIYLKNHIATGNYRCILENDDEDD